MFPTDSDIERLFLVFCVSGCNMNIPHSAEWTGSCQGGIDDGKILSGESRLRWRELIRTWEIHHKPPEVGTVGTFLFLWVSVGYGIVIRL